MNVILDIPDEILTKFNEAAAKERRSRKNFMEQVLIQFFKKDYSNKLADSANWTQAPASFTKPKIRRSFENYQQLILDCASSEEYAELVEEIESSEHLTQKQKNLLLKR